MSATRTGAAAVSLLISVILALVSSQVSDSRVSADHGGHLRNNYFAAPFIEDIPNTPTAFVQVFDCAEPQQNHTHPTIITGAVSNWNNTGLVRFFYPSQNATTPCDLDGFPTDDDRISILHAVLPEGFAGTHISRTYSEAFRDNDIGAEGDLGMYRQRVSRIRIDQGGGGHSVRTLVHELGHAAGLGDLKDHSVTTHCKDGHPHTPDNTIMDCSGGDNPGQHDTFNLDLLYKRAPEQVNDFLASTGGTSQIRFEWTDRSYTEKFQYIAETNAPFPLAVPRDAESATWVDLQPGTVYCFVIQPVNACGQLPPSSAQTCATTTQVAVGGIIELPAVAGTALDAPEAGGGSAGVLAGIAAGGAAVVLAVGGAAWYATRRRHS